MDRTEFMDIVYDLLKNDPDNNRANSIIVAADEYAEDAAKEALEGGDINVLTKDESIPYQWIVDYLAWLKDIGGYGLSDARAIKSMIIKWKMEHTDGCGPDYCDINFGGGTKA